MMLRSEGLSSDEIFCKRLLFVPLSHLENLQARETEVDHWKGGATKQGVLWECCHCWNECGGLTVKSKKEKVNLTDASRLSQ